MKIQTSRHFLARLTSRRFARMMKTSATGAFAAVVALGAVPGAFGDQTKKDNTTALNLGASYVSGVLPTSADKIIFDNTILTVGNNTAAVGGDLSIAGISFGTTTALTNGAFSINATQGATLTLGTSGIALTSSSINLNINAAVALSGSQAFDVVTGRTLSLTTGSGGSLDLGASTNVLTVQGAGNTSLAGLIYGSGSITKTGAGTLTIGQFSGFASSSSPTTGNFFSGGINVSGGTVTTNAFNSVGTGAASVTGTGTLTITQPQLIWTGGLTINGGTANLTANDAGGLGAITLTTGTLTASGGGLRDNTVTLNSGTFTPGASTTIGALSGTQGFTTNASAGTLTFGTNNANGSYSGNIAGANASAIVKQGFGTQALNGTNATTGTITANGSGGTLAIGGQFGASGAVAVQSGTLQLNFGTNNTVASNLVGAGALSLSGGTLSVVGQTGATNAIQNFSGTTLTAGTASTVSATNGAGAGTTAVNLAGFTRNAGSAVNFNLPSGTQSATNGIQTSSGSTGLLVPTNNTAYATVGGTDFAAKDATNTFIVPLSGTVNATGGASLTGTATDNANINSASVSTSGASTINTVRFNNAAGSTLTLGGALTVTDGGILISSAVTIAGSKITGGSITTVNGSTPAEVVIHQFSAQPFTLDSQVTGNTALVKTGPGTLIVTQANTNSTGNVGAYVDSGILRIGAGGSFAGGNVNLSTNDPTAVFDVNNQTTAVSYLSGGGGTGGYVTLGNSGTLNINTASGASSTYSGTIVGGLGSVINKGINGAGNAQYTAGIQGNNQAFFGTININAGQLGIFGGNDINATVNVNTGTSSSLGTGGGGATLTLGNLGGTGGTVLAGSNASANSTFNIGYLGGTSSYAGVIANGTNATTPGLSNVGKFGSGTTTLSGANTFTGTTSIFSGGLTFDYSTGNDVFAAATPGALVLGGGTATFRGGTGAALNADTTGAFGIQKSVQSSLILDNNGGAGYTVTLKTTAPATGVSLASDSIANTLVLDTSSSAGNLIKTDVAITAADATATTAIRLNNGILGTGGASTGFGYRANVLIRDTGGYGFATTSGTSIIKYTAATDLTTVANGTSSSDTTNYKLTASTYTNTAQILFSTLQLDSSSNPVVLTNVQRFGNTGGGANTMRTVLATGTNGVTITGGAGANNQALQIYNFQNGSTLAGQTLNLDIAAQANLTVSGIGLINHTQAVDGAVNIEGGVYRQAFASSFGDALTSGNGILRITSGGVLEIGADLTSGTSSTSAGNDFSRSVGPLQDQVSLTGDTGFSAYTGTVNGMRTVNLGGNATPTRIVWGTDGFLVSPSGYTSGNNANSTVEGNQTFKLSSAYADSTLIFQNPLVLGNITRNVDVADGSAAVDARLSGVLSGVAPLNLVTANSNPAILFAAAGLTKLGAGTLDLTAANTFSGQTTVVAGALELSNALALQNSNLAPLTNGVIFNSSVSGNAFTVGGLTGAATNNDLVLQNNAGTPAAIALTVGNNNSSPVYAGVLSGAGSLTKIGAGTQTLSGTNTYTGTTTVSAGTLQIGNGGTSGQFGVGGAVINNGAVVFNRTDSMTMVSNAISGTGTLTQAGTGITGLTNNNTYSGATNVNAGTLLINNTPVSGVDSGTGTGLVTVNNGGTLGGAGAIAGATTVNGGGQITGGTVGSVGTLTLRNNLTFSGATGSLATFLVDIGSGTNNSDTLAIGGVLDLSGAFDRITFTGMPDSTSSYVLATYASVSSTFDNGAAPAGYAFQYNSTELDLVPTPVPEPATVFGGLLMVGSLGFTQRRRVRGLIGVVQGLFQAA